MTEWKKYDRSDDQIAELRNAWETTGLIVKWKDGESDPLNKHTGSVDFWYELHDAQFTHYWIIPDDPLREMKARQAMTGQPVWVIEEINDPFAGDSFKGKPYITTTPDWYMPNAEYSFTPFED